MVKIGDEPKYYKANGMSPMEAFSKGLLSRDEYVGFIKGNIIKYVVRCEYKNDDPIGDLDKASNYLYELYCVIGSEKLGISIEEFKLLSELSKIMDKCECGDDCECKIDKYVSIFDETGLVDWIRDESSEKVIVKVSMDSKEHTELLLSMCLDALNSGDFEPVESVDEFSVFKENLRQFASIELDMPTEAIDEWFNELSTQKEDDLDGS